MQSGKTNTPTNPVAAPVSLQGVGISISTMLVLNAFGTVIVHPTNVIAAAAVKENVRSIAAAKKVYTGLGEAPKNTSLNFFRGTKHHYAKESVRALARAPGLAYLNPYLQTKFSPTHSALAFAGILSFYEMLINALDAAKAKAATGQQFNLLSKDSFAGSFGNGARIFISWYAFLKATEALNPALTQQNIDPNSVVGMLVRAPFQSLAWTMMSYPLEGVLRRLQVSQEDYKPKSLIEVGQSWRNYAKGKESLPKSVYLQVAKDVSKKFGGVGFLFGFSSKLITNTGLSVINNAVPVASKEIRNYLRPK